MPSLHWLPCVAAVLLTACAAHKTPRATAPTGPKSPVPAAPGSAPTAPAPPRKPTQPEKNFAAPVVPPHEGLLAREVGYYLDVLQGRLQQQLDPAVIIGRERGGIVLDFSRRLGFAPDSVQPDDADRALLAPLAKVLDEYRLALVSVRVSADADGAIARKLAQQRADGVARLLTGAGIAAARIVAVVPDAIGRGPDAHVEIVLAPETRGD